MAAVVVAPPPVPLATAVERSDVFARKLVAAIADFAPEGLAQMGVIDTKDEAIVDLGLDADVRFRARMAKEIVELEAARALEKDEVVAQDLDILIKRAKLLTRVSELEEKRLLTWMSVAHHAFNGIKALLDDQVPPERRAKALVRLRKYAGIEPGYRPATELSMARARASFGDASRVGPVREEVLKEIADIPTYKKGIADLFAKYQIPGCEDAVARLSAELDLEGAFLQREILPRARPDFRLPEDVYAIQLEKVGIDIPPAELVASAHRAFGETLAEMQALAPEVARAEGIAATDALGVVAALKKHQVGGDALIALYKTRIAALEEIIRREHLVTLPSRPMLFRLASAAETASSPAPHIDIQGLFGKGKNLSFVLPLSAEARADADAYDDFTFDAAAWTIGAHEGRPGHDLQLSVISERGLSLARKLFAFNSVNVEGWGLYAERLMRPFMPPAGRLVSLQGLLLREARAFLDPELQTGKSTVDQARDVLLREVGTSRALAKEEIERFTFRSPGQAPSYFYGYTHIVALRARIEKLAGPAFNAQKFHDTVIDQGLLPPDVLERAVVAKYEAHPVR